MMDAAGAWAAGATVLIVLAVAASIRAIRRARQRWMRLGRTQQVVGQWGAEARLQHLEADLEAARLAGDRAVVRSAQRQRQIENLRRTNEQLMALLEMKQVIGDTPTERLQAAYAAACEMVGQRWDCPFVERQSIPCTGGRWSDELQDVDCDHKPQQCAACWAKRLVQEAGPLPDPQDTTTHRADALAYAVEQIGEPRDVIRRVVSIRGITIPISEQEAARIMTVAAEQGMSTADFVEQMFRAGMVATETATAGGPSSLRRLAEPAATAGHRSPPYNDGG